MPISVLCCLVQVACLSSILYTRVRWALEDKKRRRSNSLGQIGPSGTDEDNQGGGSGRTSTGRGNPPRKNAENRIDDIEMNAADHNLHKTIGNKAVRLNTSAHNKTILEVYQLFFSTLIVAAIITIVTVNRQFKDEYTMGSHSHLLLCFLDLAPCISMSVLLPLTVYLHNPEMQNYICGLFKCQRQ